MHGRWLAAIGWMICTAFVLAQETPRQQPTPESLASVVAQWQQTMLADAVTTRLATLDAMSPNAGDAVVMFPRYADKLGRYFELIKRRQADGLASTDPAILVAERAKQRSIKRVRAIDVRAKDPKNTYKAVLDLLPQGLPVYRVVIEYDDMRTSGSSSYVFVNGRWIYVNDLKSFPELLPKLDMALQQLEKQA